MWPHSAEFAALVKSGGYVVAHRFEVLRSRAVVASLEEVVLSGRVSIDVNAAVRRRCDVSVVDESGDLTPDSAADLLTVYGNEIRLWRGISSPLSVPELIPLGTFGISEVEATEDVGVTLKIVGYDRADAVSRARFEQPYVVAAGTNYGQAIQDLITSRLPGFLDFDFVSTSTTTPQLVFTEGDDPWAKANEMARSLGNDLAFDAMGRLVMRPEPDPQGSPVWTYSNTEAMLLGLTKRLSNRNTYNGAVVTGESSGAAPVRSIVWDDDSNSPTYYLGPYGKVPEFLQSQFIATQTQADGAAEAMVLRKTGASEGVSFPAMVHPAHTEGDVVQITRSELGVDAIYILDQLEIPLEEGAAMSATTRTRRA